MSDDFIECEAANSGRRVEMFYIPLHFYFFLSLSPSHAHSHTPTVTPAPGFVTLSIVMYTWLGRAATCRQHARLSVGCGEVTEINIFYDPGPAVR